MDLFGEQTVHLLTASLQAVILLLVAAMLVGWSARIFRSTAWRPERVQPFCTGRFLCPEGDVQPSSDGLHLCLLTRAPPDRARATSISQSRVPDRPDSCASTLDSSQSGRRLARRAD